MRKFIHRLQLTLSRFEIELLRFSAKSLRHGLVTHVRETLRDFARHHPAFDMKAYSRYIKKEVVPALKYQREKDDLLADLAIFERSMHSEEGPRGALEAGAEGMDLEIDSQDFFSK